MKKKHSDPKQIFDLLPHPYPVGIEVTEAVVSSFQDCIYRYYHDFGRSFPWRETNDPYRILLSEVMLQQTQTDRVLPKYKEFLKYWPSLSVLHAAPLVDVLACWKGLGYNRRVLALKRIAEISVVKYGGTLPNDQKALMKLPMVGPATSAALLAFAFDTPSLYLETNIRRVLLYFFFHEVEQVHDKELYLLLDLLLDRKDPKCWYYALMDYGVYLKGIVKNPNRRSAHYTRGERFENSNRQIRGELLTLFTEHGAAAREDICQMLQFSPERIDTCIEALIHEGFIVGEEVAETSLVYRIK